MGPIEAKLLKFGARDGPKPHAVVGFVLGAFGRLFNSLYTAIARVGVARVVSITRRYQDDVAVASREALKAEAAARLARLRQKQNKATFACSPRGVTSTMN
jgi:hypothetical protein